MARLVLYGRAWCHLCDDMRAALEPWVRAGTVHLSVVDVEAGDGLEERFGERVPVLTCEGREICHYFLDEARLREVLHPIG